MKLLFIRHGESVDDLTDQYGGWADFPLTPKGHIQLQESSEKIKNLNLNFELVLHSPLLRAKESARIIANNLSVRSVEFLYLKEHNGYGLISGLNKEEADKKYPEIVEQMKQGYAPGAEPRDEFVKRVKAGISLILRNNSENVIAVTHGGFMKVLFEEILGKTYKKAGDGGFILLNHAKGLNFEIKEVDGIEFD